MMKKATKKDGRNTMIFGLVALLLGLLLLLTPLVNATSPRGFSGVILGLMLLVFGIGLNALGIRFIRKADH